MCRVGCRAFRPAAGTGRNTAGGCSRPALRHHRDLLCRARGPPGGEAHEAWRMRQVCAVHLFESKARGPDQRLHVAIQVAAPAQPAPDGVDAILPASHPGIGRRAVLAEEQFSARPQHAVNLAQCRGGVGDRAQGEGDEPPCPRCGPAAAATRREDRACARPVPTPPRAARPAPASARTARVPIAIRRASGRSGAGSGPSRNRPRAPGPVRVAPPACAGGR